MGVVVRRYIDILIIIIAFPYSTCISSFLTAASLLLCSFVNVFSFLIVILCNIANVAQRTFEMVQKSRSRECDRACINHLYDIKFQTDFLHSFKKL